MRWMAPFLIVAASACSAPPTANEASGNEPRAEQPVPDEQVSESQAKLPSCPFRQLPGLRASITNGRLLVTGRVDFMMAGFKPQLSPRSTSGRAIALDLELVPEAQAAVNDALRYEQSGVPAVSRGEIWCGGEQLTSFNIVLAG